MEPWASEDDEPLNDTTAALALHSKKTERVQRRQATRARKNSEKASLARLPTELLLETLKLVRPSDVFAFSGVCPRFRALVLAHSTVIGDEILQRRYRILAQCFPLPVLLSHVDAATRSLLTDESRQKTLSQHSKAYPHVRPPDAQQLCTCLTCILTSNNLGLVLDFAHWQDNLDNGEPIPLLPRGRMVPWNEELVHQNASIVRAAVRDSLWHAKILETHLDSTIRSIRRHGQNKGNRRTHVDMTEEEAATGTDDFLAKAGPLSLEFPYDRDGYYMLEAYLPNRWWRKYEERWVYTIAGQHERDLDLIRRFSKI
jgi:hypothetical protein